MSSAEPIIRVVLADRPCARARGDRRTARARRWHRRGWPGGRRSRRRWTWLRRCDRTYCCSTWPCPALDGLEVTRRALGISPEHPCRRAYRPRGAALRAGHAPGGRQRLPEQSQPRARGRPGSTRRGGGRDRVFGGDRSRRHPQRPGRGTAPRCRSPARALTCCTPPRAGCGNKQIAVELGMSARTVQTHLTSVFAKLGVSSRTEAVLLAVKRGWVRADLT